MRQKQSSPVFEMNLTIEYSQLLAGFFQIVDSKGGEKLSKDKKWLFDTETFSVKLFNHLGTILYLSAGTNLPEQNGKQRHYCDHGSISVLVRAAFETYLAFYYIYVDKSCEIEEKKFRHKVWKLAGLLDRQKFKTESEENREKLIQEKTIIEQLLSDIQCSQPWKELEAKQRKKVKQGTWRINKSWSELAEIAGFDKGNFQNFYRYLCSYAHAGGLSGLQTSQAINLNDQQGLCKLSLQSSLILMSHFIFSYSSLFPETQKILEKSEGLNVLVSKWHVTWKENEFKNKTTS